MKQKENARESILFFLWFMEKKPGFFKMTLNFKYSRIPDSDGIISLIPQVPITLVGKEVIVAMAILDSGADTCVISKNMADKLGLSFIVSKEFSRGIGGRVDSAGSKMILVIQQGQERYRFNIPVTIILKSGEFPVLLGQEGFFDKFIITFDRKEESFWLKKKGGLFS